MRHASTAQAAVHNAPVASSLSLSLCLSLDPSLSHSQLLMSELYFRFVEVSYDASMVLGVASGLGLAASMSAVVFIITGWLAHLSAHAY